MSSEDYVSTNVLSNHSEAPSQDPNYVTCPICGKHVGQLGGHLADRHKEMPIAEFHDKYPNTPMTSIAVLERKRAANKQRWANTSPKERQRHGNAIKKAVAAPAVRAKHSASMKLAQSDPEIKERILAGVQRALLDPEKCERRIEGLRKALAKPQVRRRFSAARKRDWQKPEVRAKFIKHVNNIWAERNRNLAELERLKNVEGLDLKTGLRVSLAAHRDLAHKSQYQMAPDIYPDSSDPFNAIKQLFRRLRPVIEDEKQRVTKLTDDERQRDAEDLEARLKLELAKPPKKSA
jgi:hypothetical protein